jgi:protein-tyrosine phosphatase
MARIFWIPGNPPPPLAVLLCPRGGRELYDELREFKRDGIQTVVSLLDEEQVEMLDLADEGRLASSIGMQFVYNPLPDHSIPQDEQQFRVFVSGLANRLREGESVGIHCWASIGRATMVAACALIHLGWDAHAALIAVETARGCSVPDTEEQEEWILNYKEIAAMPPPTRRAAPSPAPISAEPSEPTVDLSFPHAWRATILADTPATLPARQFIYPTDVEEVELGALEVQIRPVAQDAQSFLATCALGFRDPAVPTGIWSCPRREEICAVSGGYAYVIDTAAPENFTMIPYRPVMAVRPVVTHGLLLFVSHHEILAWGADGCAWESEKLSDEGVRITDIAGGILHGMGWDMKADRETPFALDLPSGVRIPARE